MNQQPSGFVFVFLSTMHSRNWWSISMFLSCWHNWSFRRWAFGETICAAVKVSRGVLAPWTSLQCSTVCRKMITLRIRSSTVINSNTLASQMVLTTQVNETPGCLQNTHTPPCHRSAEANAFGLVLCSRVKTLWSYINVPLVNFFHACVVGPDHILGIHGLIWHAHSWVSHFLSFFFPPSFLQLLFFHWNCMQIPALQRNNKQERW